jgi:uncharacterized membrane protein
MTMTTPTTPAEQSASTTTTSGFELKLNKLAQLIGFYSVNYFFSAGVLAIMYPISEKTIAPLLSAFVPISQCTLPKALLILTLMYWLPIVWDATRRWHQNDF